MQSIQNCEQKTDEELITLVLENQGYYRCLIERYESKIARYIKRISGGSKEDIEDLLQEIFIKIYQNLNDFDKSLKFSSWVYRIAHNHVISEFRKKKSRPQSVAGEEIDEFLYNIASELNIEKDINDNDLRKDIKKVLTQLDFKYREVLILKFLEEKSYEEISDILRKPIGTVGTLINRAKKQFKKNTENLGVNF